MKKRGWLNQEITFGTEYYELVFSYLKTRSISRNHIVIPVQAKPFPTRTIAKVFFVCKLEKGQAISLLTWKSYLFPPEAIAVCFLLMFCIGMWISSIIKQSLHNSSTLVLLVVVTLFVFLTIFYVFCLCRYCKKQFIKDTMAKIDAIISETTSAN